MKLVASHLGGVTPYLMGRIDTGYQAYPECKSEIGKAPSGYLRRVWVDSLCYNRDVFMCAYSLLGPKRIVLGSDFPHQIGDIERAVGRIRDLDIPEEDKGKILGENAQELLGL